VLNNLEECRWRVIQNLKLVQRFEEPGHFARTRGADQRYNLYSVFDCRFCLSNSNLSLEELEDT
jgi:hypothetical protein